MINFKDFVPVLEKMDLTITFSQKEDRIAFLIVPKKKDGNALDMKPLTGSGTVDELNEGFMKVFNQAIGKNVGLIVNLDEVEEDLKNKKNKSKSSSSTTSSTSSTTTTAKTTPPKNEPVFENSRPAKANKTENKMYDSIIKQMDDAEKRILQDKDLDTFGYYEKAAIKAAESIKSVKNIKKLTEDYIAKRKADIEKKLQEAKPEETTSDSGLFANTNPAEVVPPAVTEEQPAAEPKKPDNKGKVNPDPKTKKEVETKEEPVVTQPHVEQVKEEIQEEAANTGSDNNQDLETEEEILEQEEETTSDDEDDDVDSDLQQGNDEEISDDEPEVDIF